MITLHVESYCSDCEDFEPEVSRLYADGEVLEQLVCCVWRDRCARVYSTAKNERTEEESKYGFNN